MESTLLFPSGTRYPRTPLNEESVNVMRKMEALLSNKKPDAQDALKMPKIPDAEIQDPKIQDAPNNDSQMHEGGQRDALNWYQARLEEMKINVEKLEKVIEDNDGRQACRRRSVNGRFEETHQTDQSSDLVAFIIQLRL